MRTIMKMLCGLAITAATISGAAIDASAAAKPAPAMPIRSATRPIVGAASTNARRRSRVSGRRGLRARGSWCYWHPYGCYYR